MGHARKVWRRIYEQWPGTGRIKNVSDFVSAGIIRAGMAVVKDDTQGADEQDYKALKWSDITTAAAGSGVDTLGIIGFLQEDVPVINADTFATCTVIKKGEIYGYMLGDTPEQAAAVATALKGMTVKLNGPKVEIV